MTTVMVCPVSAVATSRACSLPENAVRLTWYEPAGVTKYTTGPIGLDSRKAIVPSTTISSLGACGSGGGASPAGGPANAPGGPPKGGPPKGPFGRSKGVPYFCAAPLGLDWNSWLSCTAVMRTWFRAGSLTVAGLGLASYCFTFASAAGEVRRKYQRPSMRPAANGDGAVPK